MIHMNRILWTLTATRQLRKLKDAALRQRIYRETQSLADFPHCQQVKKLVNAAHDYRLRVGDFRVFFSFDGAIKIIRIVEVKKRNERTY